MASRSPRCVAVGTSEGSEGNGNFSQSAPSAGTKSHPWPKGVAATPQHLNATSFLKIGCSSPRTLRYHWPGWRFGLPSRAASVDAYPSGVPCQRRGAACGQHVLGPRRGGPSAHQVDGLPEFEVKFILDSRICRSRFQYLVDWVGYDAFERTWELAANLSHASLEVETFHKLFPSKPRSPDPADSNI